MAAPLRSGMGPLGGLVNSIALHYNDTNSTNKAPLIY
jgi:hypothetical protein